MENLKQDVRDMAEIKISELEPTTDLEGLYTIGSDKNNLSKKVSLQFLREAADYAIEQGDYAKQEGSTIESRITEFKAETDVKLTELESEVDANWSRIIGTTANGAISTKQVLKVDLKSGDRYNIQAIDEDNCLSVINAFYYIPSGGTDDDRVALVGNANPNEKYSFVAPTDIEYITLYVASAAKTGSFILKVEGNGLVQRLANYEGVVNEVESLKTDIGNISDELTETKNQIDSHWSRSIGTTANAPISTKQVLKVEIKKGDKFTIQAIDTNNCLSVINAFYYIPSGGTDDDRVALVGNANPNEKYSFVASTDIDYITLYVASAAKTDTFILNVEGNGLVQRLDRIDYKKVKQSEELSTLKRFLPHTIQTSEEGLKTFAHKNWEGACNILFFTDSHVDDARCAELNVDNVRDVVEFANNQQRIAYDLSGEGRPYVFDAAINGGDAISSSYDEGEDRCVELIKPFFAETKGFKMPFIYSKGNHDMLLGDDSFNSLYGNWADTHNGSAFVRQTKANGKKSSWSYLDIESKKVRIICIDVNDVDKSVVGADGKPVYNGGTAWYIAQEQMSWLINVALNFDSKADKNWGVIVIGHQSIQIAVSDNEWYGCRPTPSFEGSIDKFFNVLHAFNTQSQYNNEYTFDNSFYNLSINADFTRYASESVKPHVVCWLNGHEHVDYSIVKDGINMIWTAQGAAMMAYGSPKVLRSKGTSTQNLFDCISIDTIHRKIRIVRYGAGVDCYGNGGDRWIKDGLSY